MKLTNRLHLFYQGFFRKDDCFLCGRGDFAWRCLLPQWGAYRSFGRECAWVTFYWVSWGPFELRYYT